MSRPVQSSRRQFEQYRAESFQRNTHPRDHHRRERSTWTLIASFVTLLRGQRLALTLSLVTLTFATLLALIPPAATKFVVDYVLGGKPLPANVPAWVPREPWQLLIVIILGVFVITVARLFLHMSSRWQSTRVTKITQLSLRKRVFEHI